MPDRSSTPIRAASLRPGLSPQATIAALADELERRALAFERQRDARCVFARAYASLTRVLSASLPRADFEDPSWIAELAVVHAEHYLRALREHDARSLVRGAWSAVFQAGRDGRTSVLEDLVLGMTAHVVNDLPLALCEVGMTSARGHSRIADFHVMNEVLAHAIETIRGESTRRYGSFLGVLDHCVESYDEILTGYGLRVSRANAFYNAQRLLDPDARSRALAAIARSPEITLHELLEPPLLSLRQAFRTARVVARAGRRWPNALPARDQATDFQAIVL